jgi:dihydroneopterin aldolase
MTRARIRLLASVTGPEEAELAIRGGADLVDLKDPASGALGALPIRTIRFILDRVAGRAQTSATIGDLPADSGLVLDAIRATAATGVDYVKIGFFSNDHVRVCLPVVAALAQQSASGAAVVAVLFADRSPPIADLTPFAQAGCAGVMLDTADKGSGRLLDCLTPEPLAAFVRQAQGLGLLCGLAGSLRLADIPVLRPLGPDYLGFRGALCDSGQRARTLDPERLRTVREAIGYDPQSMAIGPNVTWGRPLRSSPEA